MSWNGTVEMAQKPTRAPQSRQGRSEGWLIFARRFFDDGASGVWTANTVRSARASATRRVGLRVASTSFGQWPRFRRSSSCSSKPKFLTSGVGLTVTSISTACANGTRAFLKTYKPADYDFVFWVLTGILCIIRLNYNCFFFSEKKSQFWGWYHLKKLELKDLKVFNLLNQNVFLHFF